MTKKLKILFNASDMEGHVNASVGLAQRLQARGHQIIFVTNESQRNKLQNYKFVLELTVDQNRENQKNSVEHWAEFFMSDVILRGNTSLDKFKAMINTGVFQYCLEMAKNNESFLKSCIDRYTPDIIVIDSFGFNPSLLYAGKPWITLCSTNPLFIFNQEKLPPSGSGYPINSNINEWIEFKEIFKDNFAKLKSDLNAWLIDNGYPAINSNRQVNTSPYLNLYNFPEEIDYTDVVTIPENYIRFDTLIRSENGFKFNIPNGIANKNGKLIYLSLGSMGSVNVDLMKKLVNILSKSSDRFIVSKGRYHYKYKLSDNMYGHKTIPQTLVLPFVDLVITHGGNNTVTETFYFGKPMIVMPLFGDQFDNAQRIHEKGFGVRLDPFTVTESELLTTIENLLNDSNLKLKLEKVSKRIQSTNSVDKALERIEKLAHNNYHYIN